MARPWIDYLARCSAMLSAGRPAVDIAVFVGEEAPVTGLFDATRSIARCRTASTSTTSAPTRWRDVLRVEDGALVSDGRELPTAATSPDRRDA